MDTSSPAMPSASTCNYNTAPTAQVVPASDLSMATASSSTSTTVTSSPVTSPAMSEYDSSENRTVPNSPRGHSLASSISSVDELEALDDDVCTGENGSPSDLDLLEIRDTLVTIARAAGDMILAADPSVDTSDTKKNTSDRVTATDKAVEAMVKASLTSYYPSIEFLGEESFKEGQKISDAPTFVVDPIDGTLNFIHGFPNTAVSLALTIAKKPVVGVVFNPFRQDLYTAVKGHGAHLSTGYGLTRRLPLKQNPVPLDGLNGSLVAVEWGSERSGPHWELRSGVAKKLLTSTAEGGAMCHSLRSSGSAALDFCYVASGQLDLFWEAGCWCWDVCAGWIILEEAGGLVASANPGDWEPTLEGRLYFAVRPAPQGQREIVEEFWALMDGKEFSFRS